MPPAGFPGMGGRGTIRVTPPAQRFPLSLSGNGRYLVDATGAPFLINQASSWGLIQCLSENDARDYLDALQARAFNTVMVSIISNDVRFAGGPPNWTSPTGALSPFTTQWDFSTYNIPYFAHADVVIDMAAARGMMVGLVPCYLGYSGDVTQGWSDEMASANNSVAKCSAYGNFLGARYASRKNVFWIAGGDNSPASGSALENMLLAVVDGIRAQAPSQLWAGHWDAVGTGGSIYSKDNTTFASRMTINGHYAFNYDPVYQKNLAAYSSFPSTPMYNMDEAYETEPGGTADNIRRKAYQGMLCGNMGSSFNAGPNWYLFANWRANMDTQGTTETRYWYRMFASRPWQDLVPDTGSLTVTAGRGSLGTNNYVCAARTPSGSCVIAYLVDTANTITVDMSRVSGSSAKCWWYDSTTGVGTLIGTYATSGSRSFTAPNTNGNLLVIDDASLNLSAPGS